MTGRTNRIPLLAAWCLAVSVQVFALRTAPPGSASGVFGDGHHAPELRPASQSIRSLPGCSHAVPLHVGNWLNPDPIRELGGLNLYGFVGNSPVARIDADGRWPKWLSDFFNPPYSGFTYLPTAGPPSYGPPTAAAGNELVDFVENMNAGVPRAASGRAGSWGAGGEDAVRFRDELGHELVQQAVLAAVPLGRAEGLLERLAVKCRLGKLGRPEAGLFQRFGVKPGQGFNPSAPSAGDGWSYITYAFKDSAEDVVYVGRASGIGTPQEVLLARLAKGHDHFDDSLSAIVVSVQGSKLASQGAEEFFIQAYRELGAPLRNIDESLSFANRERVEKSIAKLDAFFKELFTQKSK